MRLRTDSAKDDVVNGFEQEPAGLEDSAACAPTAAEMGRNALHPRTCLRALLSAVALETITALPPLAGGLSRLQVENTGASRVKKALEAEMGGW